MCGSIFQSKSFFSLSIFAQILPSSSMPLTATLETASFSPLSCNHIVLSVPLWSQWLPLQPISVTDINILFRSAFLHVGSISCNGSYTLLQNSELRGSLNLYKVFWEVTKRTLGSRIWHNTSWRIWLLLFWLILNQNTPSHWTSVYLKTMRNIPKTPGYDSWGYIVRLCKFIMDPFWECIMRFTLQTHLSPPYEDPMRKWSPGL